jgi:hypothetical protein
MIVLEIRGLILFSGALLLRVVGMVQPTLEGLVGMEEVVVVVAVI